MSDHYLAKIVVADQEQAEYVTGLLTILPTREYSEEEVRSQGVHRWILRPIRNYVKALI